MNTKDNETNVPKLCTDYNQSVLLSEYLPERTADMSWTSIYDENHMISDYRGFHNSGTGYELYYRWG